MTRKWIKINDSWNGRCSFNKNISFKTPAPRSDLCDYGEAYIVVKGRISVTCTNNANKRNKNLTFKNNTSFMLCVSKTNNTIIDNAEDLNIIILKYNQLG